jgi:two-component system phosphate regulon sensor histidine kinase PhoR
MSEKIKFVWILIIATIVGVLSDYVLLTLVFALVVYIMWLIDSIETLKNWVGMHPDMQNIPHLSDDFNKTISGVIKLHNALIAEKNLRQKSIVRFNEVLRSFPYPTVITNADSEIIWVGKNSAKLLKLHRKKDVGLKIYNIVRNSILHEKLISKQASEVQISAPSDENIILAIALSKVSKNIRILSIRDVSERRYLEKMRKNFIANASHELRTPLTVISGYLQILKEKLTLDVKYQPMLDDAYKHTKMMEILIADLLTLSSLESNLGHYRNSKAVNLGAVINEAVHNLYINTSYKGRLQFNIDNTITIKGVYSQLYSIVFNLLENALKYSDDSVKINLYTKEQQAILEVIDYGNGIHDFEKMKILEPFYRITTDSYISGTGLGLSIVNQAVINADAILNITDNTPCGAKFSVIFSTYEMSK